MGEFDRCGDGIVVKKRPDGIQLKCLNMYANNVILKMRSLQRRVELAQIGLL